MERAYARHFKFGKVIDEERFYHNMQDLIGYHWALRRNPNVTERELQKLLWRYRIGKEVHNKFKGRQRDDQRSLRTVPKV